MRPKLLFLLATGLVMALSSRAALARDVYFNGVKLDAHVTLRNQTLQNCEVRFDADGNVHITARGYKVSLAAAGPEGAATADEAPATKVTLRYWLVAPQPKRGVVQYDIDVFMNGTFVKRVRSGDDKAVLEVTRYVRPGANAVRIIATKNIGDRRASSSPQ